MSIALVNTNQMKPAIAPIGLEYVAETLIYNGYDVEILDLCWENDERAAIARFFSQREFDLIGVTLRNTDDCAFHSRSTFLNRFADIIDSIGLYSNTPIVVGGVGFSVMPEVVLESSGADAGIWGEGEFAILELADRISGKQNIFETPNLIWGGRGKWHTNRVRSFDLRTLPIMTRSLFDNRRYFGEGGQIGFESKRGCTGQCIYCADPVAKGREVRTRPPQDVADELRSLVRQGIDHFHTCDAEFNLPEHHALAVCQKLIESRLGEKMRWYAYCTPASFSKELAQSMRHAGCVGINFGVDNGNAQMLKRLKRGFSPEDILHAVRVCQEENIAVMLDLLLGSPGESKTSLFDTIELMKRASPQRVGVTIGVRVYQGTELATRVARHEITEGLIGMDSADDPLYYLEPKVAETIFSYIDEMIADDERFLFFDPTKGDRNYNYNANQRLIEAIREGYRGAYWDILRQYPRSK